MNLIIKSARIIDINSKYHNKIMDVLIKNKWDENILEYLDKKKPLLGICLCMQLLFIWGE